MLNSIGPSLDPCLTSLFIEDTPLKSFMCLLGASSSYIKQLTMFQGDLSYHSFVKIAERVVNQRPALSQKDKYSPTMRIDSFLD